MKKINKDFEVGVSDMGFSFIKFKDAWGDICKLQKSGRASRACIWLGLITPTKGCEYPPFMELTQKQVKALLPYLENFVKTGEIIIEEEVNEQD